jgi:hypothetical protein
MKNVTDFVNFVFFYFCGAFRVGACATARLYF